MTPPSATAARSRYGAAPAAVPLRRPIAPRRLSGPARHPRARSNPRSAAFVRLLDAPFLDRLIRGRIWIGLVAFALLGVVAMQVAILRLGTGIGHSVAEIQQLTQSNEAAETAIAATEPGRDVASEATSLGMVYPPPADVVYLRFEPGDAARAAASITRPTALLITPAAASLTAPIEPAVGDAADPLSQTTAADSTQTQTETTPDGGSPTATGTTPASPDSSATTDASPPPTTGGASQTSDSPAATGAIGAGGGSAAPGG